MHEREMKQFFSNRGIALLMVLWVLMLLTVIVGEFCFAMKTRVNITRNFKESTEAYYIAVAGLNKAIEQTILLQTAPKIVSVEEDDEADMEDDTVEYRMNTPMPPIPFGSGAYEIRIENESGKINLNLADRDLLRVMLGSLDLDDEEKDVIADSIMDWRDSDRNHRLNGAENDYYQSLPDPYECKDAEFDAREELLRVRGVTPEIYQVLAASVTVFPKTDAQKKSWQTGKKKQKTEFDYNRLNINAISLELWAAFPGMTEALVADIGAFRAEKDFVSLREVVDILGPDVYRGLAKYLTTQTSPYFVLRSKGKIPGSRISEGVSAVIMFDLRAKKKYQMIQWTDDIARQEPGNNPPVS
jgi:general secretion pathway protein K